jgi:toxin YoeB
MRGSRKPPRRAGIPRVERTLIVATHFLADLQYWLEHDWRIALRVVRLMREVARDPFHGIAKPEPLKHDRAGMWSRRIDREHRVLYDFDENAIQFVTARFHYE